MEFPDLNKMREMMGQAKQMQEQMETKLAASVVEASSGGGVVTVRMNGKKEVLRVKIEPTAMGSTASDLELLWHETDPLDPSNLPVELRADYHVLVRRLPKRFFSSLLNHAESRTYVADARWHSRPR